MWEVFRKIIYSLQGTTLKKRLDSQNRPSITKATQYLFQLLLAMDYLESQQLNVPIDLESIYLNDFGSLRLSFALSKDARKVDW